MPYSFNQQAVKKPYPSRTNCGKGNTVKKGKGKGGGTKGLAITTS